MKRISLTGGVCAMLLSAATATTAWAGHVDPDLQKVIDRVPADQIVSALVYLNEQVDIQQLEQELKDLDATRDIRHEEVVRSLRDTAAVTQGDLHAHLTDLAMQDRVAEFTPYWIANFFHVKAVGSELVRLAAHPEVDTVYLDYKIELVEPVERIDAMNAEGDPLDGAPEPGVVAVRAPEVWNMGFRGEGVLVAHLDTGVAENHPALSSRWRGHDPAYAGNPEWAYFDPNGICTPGSPCDSGSHGTHTMGTICGGAPGDQVGVAPGAEWISAAVIDIGGIGNTVVQALAAFQWMIDPDGNAGTTFDVPQTCSNSWGLLTSHGYNPCDETFWTPIDNCEAAGIVVLFSAGNEGSSEMRRPSDRATDDYSTAAVAAVDGNNPSFPIASFSSRGPTTCTPGGQQAIKPEISAPGVSVRSSIPGGGYSNFSGTSMASPHINGVAALMLQANPGLGVDELKQIMYDTALDLGQAGNDNSYGHGMVDAFEAVNEALSRASLQFQYPNGRPPVLDPNGGTTFQVDIIPFNATPIPDTGLLHYSIDGGSYVEIAMTETSQNIYDATFPALPCLSAINYYVSVDTDQGRITNPVNAPGSSYSAAVYTGILVAYTEDFEADNGWTVDNQNLLTGAWERAVPAGSGGTRGDPPTDFDGSGNAFVTGNGLDEDVDGGPTVLTSPTIDASTLADPFLSYGRWFSTDDGLDPFSVEISNNDGASYTTIESVIGGGGGWLEVTIRIADFVPPTSTMRLRVSTEDEPNDSVTEAAFDGVQIFAFDCGDNNTAFPTSFVVGLGNYQSGGITELAQSDDQYLTIRQRAPLSPLLPSIRLTVDSTSPRSSVSEILHTVEVNSSALPANGLQRIHMYNYDTAGFEVVDERDATLSDTVIEVNITTNANRFIESGTDAISTRIDWFQPASVLLPKWFGNTDQAKWEMTE